MQKPFSEKMKNTVFYWFLIGSMGIIYYTYCMYSFEVLPLVPMLLLLAMPLIQKNPLDIVSLAVLMIAGPVCFIFFKPYFFMCLCVPVVFLLQKTVDTEEKNIQIKRAVQIVGLLYLLGVLLTGVFSLRKTTTVWTGMSFAVFELLIFVFFCTSVFLLVRRMKLGGWQTSLDKVFCFLIYLFVPLSVLVTQIYSVFCTFVYFNYRQLFYSVSVVLIEWCVFFFCSAYHPYSAVCSVAHSVAQKASGVFRTEEE